MYTYMHIYSCTHYFLFQLSFCLYLSLKPAVSLASLFLLTETLLNFLQSVLKSFQLFLSNISHPYYFQIMSVTRVLAWPTSLSYCQEPNWFSCFSYSKLLYNMPAKLPVKHHSDNTSTGLLPLLKRIDGAATSRVLGTRPGSSIPLKTLHLAPTSRSTSPSIHNPLKIGNT